MYLYKIIGALILIWLIIKVKRFVSEIKINKNSSENLNYKESKDNMDIRDADYEEIE